jgi:hypothetical protein
MTAPPPPTAPEFIAHLTAVAQAVEFGAGVGGVEIAGGILSYLSARPDQLAAFMAHGFDALPADFWMHGSLAWTSVKGELVSPAWARRAAKIAVMAQPKDPRS